MKLIQSKTTGIYSVTFKTQSGKNVTRNLKTKNKQEAIMLVKEAKIEELETAAKINALTKDAYTSIVANRNILLSDCINEWYKFSNVRAKSQNTIYTQSGLIRKFGGFAKIKHLSDITASQIRRWLNSDEDVNLNSRKQRLAALRSLFSYAIANSYVVKDPTAEVAIDASKLSHKQKETKSRQPFTEEEFILMKEASLLKKDPFYYCAIMLGWWTGLRIIDISKLEWDSWCSDFLTVWTEKQDKRVRLPLDHPLIGGGELRDMLAIVGHHSKKYMFPAWAECSSDPKRRSKFSVNFGRFLDSLGIEGKSFHCFRHTFVTRLYVESGHLDYDQNLGKIASWVGHSDSKTTKGYLHS
tara:strand:+ start:3702 stop:4766 length:1065 start_codon:yes stop_codon:yes gene_type:complete